VAEPSQEEIIQMLKERIDGTFPGDLGMEPLEITKEHARGRLVVDRRHLHPGGYVHGGAWVGFADSVAAWVTFANLPRGGDFTTIELKLNVFKAGREGDAIEAVARPLHVGQSTIVVEVEMTREGDRVAHLIVTQFVISPQSSDLSPQT
jgi:1,4-dihydroxy-2-naphthoyl-CoA hydrolase